MSPYFGENLGALITPSQKERYLSESLRAYDRNSFLQLCFGPKNLKLGAASSLVLESELRYVEHEETYAESKRRYGTDLP